MRGFIGLSERNILLYAKDVQAIFFSLLTSIIIFGLYLLFLKGNLLNSIESALGGLESLITHEECEMLVSGLMLTGVLGSALITVPFSCLSTIVRDRENRIDYDISATPMRRWQIILSYFVSAAICAVVVTSLLLTVGLFILSGSGELYLSTGMLLASYGVVLFGALSATAVFMVIVLFFRTQSACGAFSGILSAVGGFVIGAYLPISEFSEGIQTLCCLFPASHVTILLRNTLLNGMLDHMNEAVKGLDNGMFVTAIRDAFTFKAKLFGESFSCEQMVTYIGVVTIVAVAAMTQVYRKSYKRK